MAVLGEDITIVEDCELVPDMIKDSAKKPLRMGKTPCCSLCTKGISGWVGRISRKRGEKRRGERGMRRMRRKVRIP